MSQNKNILLQLPLQKRLQFKEAVRKQTFKDYDGRGFQEKIKTANRFSNLESALICSLSWSNTKQGHDYWNNIYENFKGR